MRESQRLRWSDIRSLLRVGNELHELSDNPIVRHEHMLRQLCRLVGASMGLSALLDLGDGFRRHMARDIEGLLFFVYAGCEPRCGRPTFNRYLRTLEPPDPSRRPLIRLLCQRSGRPATRTRDQLVSDHTWYRSRHVIEVRRPADLDHALYSVFPVPGTHLATSIVLNRAWEERPFTQWHRRLVHLFHSQAGWLFQWHAPRQPAELALLSPRQHQTLQHLLEGRSEKQIAVLLGRSRHTVHIHVKAIYRAFGVSSRAELLARFLKEPRLN